MRERYSYAFRALGNRAPAGPADAPDRSPDMRSRARFLKGLPIHRMLAPFPLAFGIGACVFDLVGLQLGLPGWYTAGRYLLGGALVGGLVAAVPGLVDFFWSIPRGGVARRRARRHMFVSGAALPLAWLAFWVRGAPGVAPDPPVVALEVVVALLLFWSGFQGVSLVYRDRIGVLEDAQPTATP